jgi:hypothetical protein
VLLNVSCFFESIDLSLGEDNFCFISECIILLAVEVSQIALNQLASQTEVEKFIVSQLSSLSVKVLILSITHISQL